MDHQQAAIRSNRHDLQRPTRGIITEKHQPLLQVSSRRQNRLCHRARPIRCLRADWVNLINTNRFCTTKQFLSSAGMDATRIGSSGDDLVQSLHARCELIQGAGLDPRTQGLKARPITPQAPEY
jgi:hypothetical protein